MHLPLEVPPGVRALVVAYDYSSRIPSDPELSGGNPDIGLFDPRGTDAGGLGFRGWSGSHKLEFTIGETWATPPYPAGPIQPGTWHVLLGPYKVAPGGCHYEVTISFLERYVDQRMHLRHRLPMVRRLARRYTAFVSGRGAAW